MRSVDGYHRSSGIQRCDSVHDANPERVSNGTGTICEHTCGELLQYDFGVKFSEEFHGMKILRFEEILQKLSCYVVMNIHIKPNHREPYNPALFRKILVLIDRYDCRKYVYFMSVNQSFPKLLQKPVPDIGRCAEFSKKNPDMMELAIQYECSKIQLFKPYFDQDMIDRAHANGIRCNVFWSDDPEKTEASLNRGIDTIRTNDYHRVAQVVQR